MTQFTTPTRTQIIDIPHAMLLSSSSYHLVSTVLNSLCGGACQLEIISTPNDDMYSGSF